MKISITSAAPLLAIVFLPAIGGPGEASVIGNAVERGDADALMLMAHKQYWEDSGTPSGSDDYGFEGLRNVLLTRLLKASDIRYSLRYVGVSQQCKGDLSDFNVGCRAAVDVMIDASFTITNAYGKAARPDKRDQNQLVLEWDGKRWMFLSGM